MALQHKPMSQTFSAPRLNISVQSLSVDILSHSVLTEYIQCTQGHVLRSILVIRPIPVYKQTQRILKGESKI